MPVSAELVERSGDLKAALVSYGQARRFARHCDKALDRYLDSQAALDDAELANAMDRFLLEYQLPDGRTVVDMFVEEHIDLTEEERTLLLGWRDVVEGLFEVTRRDSDAVILTNLVDELTYRAHSNKGPAALQMMKKGSFLITRLVPIEDEWLLSGISSSYPAGYRQEMYRIAANVALQSPALVFRNPEKLAQGWEMQREERRIFVEFFGSDLVVLPGSELKERLRAYMHYRTHDVRDEDGQSTADRSRKEYGSEGPEIDFGLTDALTDAKTVGVIYDEVDGMLFIPNFGLLEEAFNDPETTTYHQRDETVLDYLHDENTSPSVFRRLAERSQERASRLFARILNRPGFSWISGGEALLREYKAAYFERPPAPSVTPISSTLTRAHLSEQELQPTATRRARPHPPARRAKRRQKRR
jgi:hypothetical protein